MVGLRPCAIRLCEHYLRREPGKKFCRGSARPMPRPASVIQIFAIILLSLVFRLLRLSLLRGSVVRGMIAIPPV